MSRFYDLIVQLYLHHIIAILMILSGLTNASREVNLELPRMPSLYFKVSLSLQLRSVSCGQNFSSIPSCFFLWLQVWSFLLEQSVIYHHYLLGSLPPWHMLLFYEKQSLRLLVSQVIIDYGKSFAFHFQLVKYCPVQFSLRLRAWAGFFLGVLFEIACLLAKAKFFD